jgi:hypothetical protein
MLRMRQGPALRPRRGAHVRFPKLNLVKLPAGTKFYADLPDGSISAEHVLTKDMEAEAVSLGPVFNVYDLVDHMTILVDVKDEIREDLVVPI